MTIEEKLKELIIKKYKTVADFCRFLNIPESTIRMALKRGIFGIQAKNLFAICSALKIDIKILLRDNAIEEEKINDFELSQGEKVVIETYRTLDKLGKDTVDYILNVEHIRKEHYDNQVNYIEKPLESFPVAAGFGESYSGSEIENILVRRTPLSEICDFVSKINGESMEPDYPDGSFVLVRQYTPLNIGDVGIFRHDNEILIKELGKGCLCSKNPAFSPIKITDEDFQVLGKVLDLAEVKE